MPKVLARCWRAAARVFHPYSRARGLGEKVWAVILTAGPLVGFSSLVIWEETVHDWFLAGHTHQALAVVVVALGFALWALYGVEKEADELAERFLVRVTDMSDDQFRGEGAAQVRLSKRERSEKPGEWYDHLWLSNLWIEITNRGEYETSVHFPLVEVFSVTGKRGKKGREAVQIASPSIWGSWEIAGGGERTNWMPRGVKQIMAGRVMEANINLHGRCVGDIYDLATREIEIRITLRIVGQPKVYACSATLAPSITPDSRS